MTQEEFNAMLAVGIAQGLPGSYYTSRFASGEEIDRLLASGGIPTGGTAWDLLRKVSDADGDVEWTALSQIWAQLVNVVHISNPNLLDNWYFLDPINQRGQTEYTEAGYTIDRWLKNFGSSESAVLLTPNGLKMNCSTEMNRIVLIQKIEAALPASLKYTISVLVTDVSGVWKIGGAFPDSPLLQIGLNTMTFTAASPVSGLYFWKSSPNADDYLEVSAIKLELGPIQTLAHKEGGRWVLNDPPPNKVLAIAKCMRYHQVLNADRYVSHRFGLGIATATDQVRLIYQLPVQMAKNPTIMTEGAFRLNHNMNTPASSTIPVEKVNLVGVDTQTVVLRAYGAVTVGDLYDLVPDSSNIGRIILDANL